MITLEQAVETLRLVLQRKSRQESLTRYIESLELGFTPAAHHLKLIEHLEALERRDIGRLMVCMPPGSAKSTYCSWLFPAWYVGRHPEHSTISCSHNDDLAWLFGRRVRNTLRDELHYLTFSTELAPDLSGAGQWETADGGQYFASGILGSMSGHRADLGTIDDPIPSRMKADSDIYRQRCWEAYINDFQPRLKPNAIRLMVTTRWHEDDLAGRCLDKEGHLWQVLSIPMVAELEDPLGRQPGERLWPEWFTEEMVEDARRDARAWNALYQQTPAALEGDYFHLDWFGEWKDLPADLRFYGASDYAASEGEGDYTEHGVFAIDAWSNVYIVDWWREQASSDVWIERQCDLILAHDPLVWFGEAGPIRKSIEPFLIRRMNDRRAFCRLEWLPSIGKKDARARSFQALASMGKVFLPAAPVTWKSDLLGQLTRFPAGRFDDGVDVCSLLGRGLEFVRPPKIAKPAEPSREPTSGSPSTSWMAG